MLREQIFGNSFSFSLKKVWAILIEEAQNFFQCKSCLFAEVSNRSHAGKAVTKFKPINYEHNSAEIILSDTLNVTLPHGLMQGALPTQDNFIYLRWQALLYCASRVGQIALQING